MQGQPLSITDSQSKDERFSKLLMSNIRTMCFYSFFKNCKNCKGEVNLLECTLEGDICCTLFTVFAELSIKCSHII